MTLCLSAKEKRNKKKITCYKCSLYTAQSTVTDRQETRGISFKWQAFSMQVLPSVVLWLHILAWSSCGAEVLLKLGSTLSVLQLNHLPLLFVSHQWPFVSPARCSPSRGRNWKCSGEGHPVLLLSGRGGTARDHGSHHFWMQKNTLCCSNGVLEPVWDCISLENFGLCIEASAVHSH